MKKVAVSETTARRLNFLLDQMKQAYYKGNKKTLTLERDELDFLLGIKGLPYSSKRFVRRNLLNVLVASHRAEVRTEGSTLTIRYIIEGFPPFKPIASTIADRRFVKETKIPVKKEVVKIKYKRKVFPGTRDRAILGNLMADHVEEGILICHLQDIYKLYEEKMAGYGDMVGVSRSTAIGLAGSLAKKNGWIVQPGKQKNLTLLPTLLRLWNEAGEQPLPISTYARKIYGGDYTSSHLESIRRAFRNYAKAKRTPSFRYALPPVSRRSKNYQKKVVVEKLPEQRFLPPPMELPPKKVELFPAPPGQAEIAVAAIREAIEAVEKARGEIDVLETEVARLKDRLESIRQAVGVGNRLPKTEPWSRFGRRKLWFWKPRG